jgi:hypothetical protein
MGAGTTWHLAWRTWRQSRLNWTVGIRFGISAHSPGSAGTLFPDEADIPRGARFRHFVRPRGGLLRLRALRGHVTSLSQGHTRDIA